MTAYLIHVPGHPPLLLDRDHPERLLGRAPGLDLTLAEPTISRRHARLSWREGEAWLEDLGSRHGCRMNGKRLEAPARVTAEDQISLGSLDFRVENVSGAPGLGAQDPESTPLALSLASLGSWRQRGESLGRLSDWRGALDLLQDVSLMMLQEMEPERMLGELLDRLYDFLDAGRGAVLFQDPSGALVPLAVRGPGAASGPPSLAPATLEATLGRRTAVLFREAEGGRLLESPTTSVMAVPVEHEGHVFGLFYFDAATGRGPFTEVDLRFVASLGNLAAAKLVQQRMAQELRRQKDRDEELRAREESARARSAFLAQMSHEIRTPMNIVLGFTHLAQGEALPPAAAEYLGRIELSGRSLVRIVNDILDFSKLEAGGVVLETAPFRLQETVANVVDQFAPSARDQGVALELAAGADLPDALLGDALRLTQVLTNLLGNAIKFTAGGKVRLEVASSGVAGGLARIRFEVQDTGPGIPPGQLEGLFSPYVQGAPSIARRYGGTGLGLAIARQLVACMGGELTVASEVGVGSRFSFTLALPLDPDGPVRAPVARESAATLPAGCRILLVDDNAWNREWTQILLHREGVAAVAADSGPEALERLGEAAFDAALIDVEMPGMDGLETVRRIRAMGLALPVIALSAHALPQYRAACLAAGMDAYLAKPFEPRVLLETLGRWIGMARREELGGPHGKAVPDLLAALAPVMDVPGALARLDGRADLLLGFLRKFLEEPIDPEEIRAAMATPDQAARLAHDLRGIAGNLGLARVAEAAGSLEARLRGQEPGPREEAWEHLKAAMDTFRACAGPVFGAPR